MGLYSFDKSDIVILHFSEYCMKDLDMLPVLATTDFKSFQAYSHMPCSPFLSFRDFIANSFLRKRNNSVNTKPLNRSGYHSRMSR